MEASGVILADDTAANVSPWRNLEEDNPFLSPIVNNWRIMYVVINVIIIEVAFEVKEEEG